MQVASVFPAAPMGLPTLAAVTFQFCIPERGQGPPGPSGAGQALAAPAPLPQQQPPAAASLQQPARAAGAIFFKGQGGDEQARRCSSPAMDGSGSGSGGGRCGGSGSGDHRANGGGGISASSSGRRGSLEIATHTAFGSSSEMDRLLAVFLDWQADVQAYLAQRCARSEAHTAMQQYRHTGMQAYMHRLGLVCSSRGILRAAGTLAVTHHAHGPPNPICQLPVHCGRNPLLTQCRGHWCDAINPRTGYALHGPAGQPYNEVIGAEVLLGYLSTHYQQPPPPPLGGHAPAQPPPLQQQQPHHHSEQPQREGVARSHEGMAQHWEQVEVLGQGMEQGHDLISHPAAGTHVYPATLFTSAPLAVLRAALEHVQGESGGTGDEEGGESAPPPLRTRWATQRRPPPLPPPVLLLRALTVRTPPGPLVVSCLSLQLLQGGGLLITGPSGAGKSTLVRCLAGLVPAEAGIASMPAPVRVMFLPQRPLLAPGGTLRQQLTYPAAVCSCGTAAAAAAAAALPGRRACSSSFEMEGAATSSLGAGVAAATATPAAADALAKARPGSSGRCGCSDAHCLRLLVQVGLQQLPQRLATGLDGGCDWGSVLSPGEVQRLALARVLHHRWAGHVLMWAELLGARGCSTLLHAACCPG